MLLTLAGIVVVGLIGGGAYVLGKSSSGDDDTDPPEIIVDPESEVSPPACDEQAAKQAVVETDFESAIRELGAVRPREPLFAQFGYVINKLICRDLTSDGAEEMVVQLACCTGSAPTPWAETLRAKLDKKIKKADDPDAKAKLKKKRKKVRGQLAELGCS